jgi:hypothetical protein
MPWQDTISTERVGWRQRAANLDGVFAFAVDYQVCLAGWVGWSNPHTLPRYRRCGLAAAGGDSPVCALARAIRLLG